MRIARFICSLLLALGLLAIPVQPRAQMAVGVSVRIGPPLLPVYAQPICPEPGFIWVPGYWAYGPDGYFRVPGTWVEPPEVGLLWTPGYWGWEDDAYIWHVGYWGPEVGFYGGINYGFGYTGVGFYGGYWRGREFFYNRAVTNVNVTVVHNTYNTTVVNNNTTINRVSFNGGSGGVNARPTSRELAAAQQRRVTMTADQTRHQQAASSNRTLLASVNHGRPDVAASVRPGQFNGHAAVESGRAAIPNRPPENPREKNRPRDASSSSGRSNSDRPPSLKPPNTTNPSLDQKHQQQLDRLHQQQAQERKRVEQKHQQEQQKLQQHAADDRRQQDTQRKQQQQLQQLEQKHAQQQQKLQQKQQQEQQRQQKPEKSSKPPRGDNPSQT